MNTPRRSAVDTTVSGICTPLDRERPLAVAAEPAPVDGKPPCWRQHSQRSAGCPDARSFGAARLPQRSAYHRGWRAQWLGASIAVTTRSAVGRKVVAGDRPIGDPFRVGGFRVEAAPLVLPVLAIVAAEQAPLRIALAGQELRADAVEEASDRARSPVRSRRTRATRPRVRAAFRRRGRSMARRAGGGCHRRSASSPGAAVGARRPRGGRRVSAGRRPCG